MRRIKIKKKREEVFSNRNDKGVDHGWIINELLGYIVSYIDYGQAGLERVSNKSKVNKLKLKVKSIFS
jgi:hypothetical protein